MAVHSGANLHMSQVNAVFGWGSHMNAYRGRQWWTDAGATGHFSAGQIGMSEFRGKRGTPPPGIRAFDYIGHWSTNNVSVNLGAEDPYRYIVMSIQIRRANTTAVSVNSCTVNGVALTLIGQHGNNDMVDGEYNRAALFGGYVPTGTVVTSSLGLSATGTQTILQCVFRLVGNNVQVLQQFPSGPSAAVFNVVPNSCIIASASSSTSSSPISITNLNRHYVIDGSGYTMSSCSRYDYGTASYSVDRSHGLFYAASFYSP